MCNQTWSNFHTQLLREELKLCGVGFGFNVQAECSWKGCDVPAHGNRYMEGRW